MTEKIYYENQYEVQCKVTVLEIVNHEGKTGARLDKTVFYPEGGGQPCDRGRIDEAVIYDVQTVDGEIIHFFSGAIMPNTVDMARIDWKRRFLHMQLHSAQHLVSALAKSLYDANTVGFHIGSDYVTVDLDEIMGDNEMEDLEAGVNEAVYKNVRINDFFPTDDEMGMLDLRKSPKVDNKIRIVEIEGIDRVPCGGTHVRNTGEIGTVKIKSFRKYKSGVRIEMVAGSLALEDYRSKTNIVNFMINQFSVKENGIIDSVKRLESDLKEQSLRITDIKSKLMDIEAEKIRGNMQAVIYRHYDDYDLNDFRHLSKRLSGNGVIRIFSTYDKAKERYGVLIEADDAGKIKLKEVMKSITLKYGAKGGGSSKAWQGFFPDRESVDRTVEIIAAL